MDTHFIKTVLAKSMNTSRWILFITLPTSFIVSVATYYGLIDFLATHLSFLFKYIGLPGEASIVFLTSIFLPLYAAVSVLYSISLSLRDVTILCSMCLIAHNMPVENTIMKKLGMPLWASVMLRIGTAIVSAVILNLVLPESLDMTNITGGNEVDIRTNLMSTISHWGISSFWLSIKIIGIVTVLIAIQEILRRYNLFEYITRPLAPIMRVMGLKKESAYLWIIAQVVGLAYSAGIISEESKEMAIEKGELRRLNIHIGISHSLLEDTMIFVMIGVQWWWVVFPKLILAIVIVWSTRIISNIKKLINVNR